jgi:hypothetical protein
MTFVQAILATYFITLLTSQYDGPFNIIVRFRDLMPDSIQEVLECFVCLSTYVAIPFAFAVADGWYILLAYPAIAGGAIAVHKQVQIKRL